MFLLKNLADKDLIGFTRCSLAFLVLHMITTPLPARKPWRILVKWVDTQPQQKNMSKSKSKNSFYL